MELFSKLPLLQTMEVLQEGEELVFLYQLTEGTTDSSLACHVMALTGTPQEIISRAAQVPDLPRAEGGRIVAAAGPEL